MENDNNLLESTLVESDGNRVDFANNSTEQIISPIKSDDSFERHERTFLAEETLSQALNETCDAGNNSNSDDSFERHETTFQAEEKLMELERLALSALSIDDDMDNSTGGSCERNENFVAQKLPQVESVEISVDNTIRISDGFCERNESLLAQRVQKGDSNNTTTLSAQNEIEQIKQLALHYQNQIGAAVNKIHDTHRERLRFQRHLQTLKLAFVDLSGKYENAKKEISKHRTREQKYKKEIEVLDFKIATLVENQSRIAAESRKQLLKLHKIRSDTAEKRIRELKAKLSTMETVSQEQNKLTELSAELKNVISRF